MINSIPTIGATNNTTDFKGLPARLHPDAHNDKSPASNVSEKAVTQTNKGSSSNNAQSSKQDDAQSKKELLDNINKINYILGSQSYLQFEIDDGTDIVKIVDTQTKETLKQFPSEQMVAFQKHISELLDKETKEFAGLLLDEKV